MRNGSGSVHTTHARKERALGARDPFKLMAVGAFQLGTLPVAYGDEHAALGFSRAEWSLITSEEGWLPAERRNVRSILSEAVNSSLERAGLASDPVPGQYVAMVICALVAPVNRLVAAARAPESYDAVVASGLFGPAELVDMPPWQMQSLVMAYSSGELVDIPQRSQVEKMVQERQAADLEAEK